jgi:hypothetical protein
MRDGHRWPPFPLSTPSDEAQSLYWRGVVALIAGATHARALLDDALAADPFFYLARIAVATSMALEGCPYRAPATTVRTHRSERQHAEIIDQHFAGRCRRAADLRREHILEYPTDLLVVWLPAPRTSEAPPERGP